MSNHFCPKTMNFDEIREELLDLLWALDGVLQDPYYHPEGDTLYHSLQVFEIATKQTDDPELWAAALLHDIGKAEDSATHADIGANALDGLLTERIVWLVRHHMDLLYEPKQTRRRLHQTPQLQTLEKLRQWDEQGRDPHARVMTPEDAVDLLLEHINRIQANE